MWIDGKLNNVTMIHDPLYRSSMLLMFTLNGFDTLQSEVTLGHEVVVSTTTSYATCPWTSHLGSIVPEALSI